MSLNIDDASTVPVPNPPRFRLNLVSVALLILMLAAPIVGILADSRAAQRMDARQWGAALGMPILVPLIAFGVSYLAFRLTSRSVGVANGVFIAIIVLGFVGNCAAVSPADVA